MVLREPQQLLLFCSPPFPVGGRRRQIGMTFSYGIFSDETRYLKELVTQSC